MPCQQILFSQEFLRGSYSANPFPPHLIIIHLYICIDFCEELAQSAMSKLKQFKDS